MSTNKKCFDPELAKSAGLPEDRFPQTHDEADIAEDVLAKALDKLSLNEHEEIFRFAAGGFRDFTRIASSDPVMWRDICLANGDMLIDLIEQYQKELDQLVDAVRLTDGNALLQLFDKAKSERDSLMQAAHE